MYFYTAFGLNIASQIEFPELVTSEDTTPDLRIELGKTPEKIKDATFISEEFSLSPTQFLQHIEKVAYYYAEFGKLIIVEPYAGADAKSLRIYLLCSAMSAIIHQRGCIPLHASGILTDEGVTLVIGDSGAGKSTTIKELSKNGHRIFTDDVCVLRKNNEKVEGIPSYPVMKLWESSFHLLELGAVNLEDKLWPDVDKFGIHFHHEFVSSWHLIKIIFILEVSETIREPVLETVKGMEAFVAIGSNTYRGWYIEPMDLKLVHFSIVNDLIKQCKVFKLTRPAEINSLSSIINIIGKEI